MRPEDESIARMADSRGSGLSAAILMQLRAEASRTTDAKKARQILAIATMLDAHPRLLAAKAIGMDRQSLRDWVHRYNAEGVAGLSDRPRSGRKPHLTADQVAGWTALGAGRSRSKGGRRHALALRVLGRSHHGSLRGFISLT